MNDKRIKLDNALHRAMLQRSALKRKLGIAGQELTPGALVRRGKMRVGEKVDDAAAATRQQLKRYSVPLGIAAIAGIGYALRRPIQAVAPQLWHQLRALTGMDSDEFGKAVHKDAAAPPPPVENDDEKL